MSTVVGPGAKGVRSSFEEVRGWQPRSRMCRLRRSLNSVLARRLPADPVVVSARDVAGRERPRADRRVSRRPLRSGPRTLGALASVIAISLAAALVVALLVWGGFIVVASIWGPAIRGALSALGV